MNNNNNINIGRLELLAWLNDFLDTDYPKIESLCDGIACIIISQKKKSNNILRSFSLLIA